MRQFNAAFKKYFNKTPSKLREYASSSKMDSEGFILTMPYCHYFSFTAFLEYVRPRLIGGVEKIEGESYWRSFEYENKKGIFQVKDKSGYLEVIIYTDDIRCCMEIYRQVRNMFALDINVGNIQSYFQNDKIINDIYYTVKFSGIPQAYSIFEFIIRAIVGQQISVKAATTITGRIVEKAGIAVKEKEDFYLFPAAGQLHEIDLSDIGLTATRIATIKNVCQAVINGELSLKRHQSFGRFKEAFCAIKGIGEWTAEYVGMRALGYADAFPVTDLGIIKSLQPYCKNGSKKEMLELAEKWRPYRSYAAYSLWNRKRRGE